MLGLFMVWNFYFHLSVERTNLTPTTHNTSISVSIGIDISIAGLLLQ